jgi:hypothetical protein
VSLVSPSVNASPPQRFGCSFLVRSRQQTRAPPEFGVFQLVRTAKHSYDLVFPLIWWGFSCAGVIVLVLKRWIKGFEFFYSLYIWDSFSRTYISYSVKYV